MAKYSHCCRRRRMWLTSVLCGLQTGTESFSASWFPRGALLNHTQESMEGTRCLWPCFPYVLYRHMHQNVMEECRSADFSLRLLHTIKVFDREEGSKSEFWHIFSYDLCVNLDLAIACSSSFQFQEQYAGCVRVSYYTCLHTEAPTSRDRSVQGWKMWWEKRLKRVKVLFWALCSALADLSSGVRSLWLWKNFSPSTKAEMCHFFDFEKKKRDFFYYVTN